MKPKPKKRKHNKSKKNFSISTPFTLQVGGKIICQGSNSHEIFIKNNVSYNKRWGIMSIIFGAFFSIMLFAISSGEFSWFYVIVVLAPFCLFGLLGLAYINKANSTVKLCFDIKKRLFVYWQDKSIPFDKISSFTFSEVQTAMDNPSSFQLNILFSNQKEVMLLTSDRIEEIIDAKEFLTSKTKIKFTQSTEDL